MAWYQKRLKAIARQVQKIAAEYASETDPEKAAAEIQRRLFSYADEIDPWAHEVADTMLKRVGAADWGTWAALGLELNKATKAKLRDALVGKRYTELQEAQVDLIKSLPREAAKTVHRWTKKAISDSTRYPVLAKRIKNELGGVTMSRAICIARTETARARTSFTQARAEAVGSKEYIWHTVGDAAVRPRHRKLNGTVQRWDDPPITSEPGEKVIRSHPGQSFNCRCFCEPLLPKSKYEK
jgi:SPP1 gp7 family putative phage head morphogenesis protein